jgi:methylase of polypeptide subunit release factors
MNKYDEMQNLIKYLKFALNTHGSSQTTQLLAGDILRIVTLFVTDRLLYSGEYGSNPEKLPTCSEALDRNQGLLKVFSTFFQDVNWNCLGSNREQLILLLANFNNRELLHIPGLVHEALLNMSDSSNVSKRKYQGSYYTPIHIVRFMVDNALRYFTGHNNFEGLKIIDPACGSGSFLLEAWYALTEAGLPETKAASCIFGIDIDDTAVRLCNYLLTVAVWARSAQELDLRVIKKDWNKRLITGNSLVALNDGSKKGFDLVIGNPPYVSNKLISLEEKKYYQTCYTSAKGQFDLSVPFIEQGLNFLKTGGILSYITSNKFLAADYGKYIRRILLEHNRIYEIIDVSTLKSFAATAAYPVIITACKKKPLTAETIKLSVVNDWLEVENHSAVMIEQDFFMTGGDYLITTRLDNSILPVIMRLEACKRLIPQAKIKCGLAMTGFNKWIVRNPLVKKNLYSFIQAGNIQPYQIHNPDYIETGHFTQAKAGEFKGVKLVIPGIATNLKAAIDYSGSILGRVYYIKQDEKTFDLNFLAVLLNSQVLNFYYKVKYWAVHLAGGYLRFNSGYLANLPIPCLPGQAGQLQEGGQSKLAEEISEMGRVLSGNQRLVEPMESIEARAEALVFCLYNLDLHDADKIMQFNGLDAAKRERIKDMMKEVEHWTKQP